MPLRLSTRERLHRRRAGARSGRRPSAPTGDRLTPASTRERGSARVVVHHDRISSKPSVNADAVGLPFCADRVAKGFGRNVVVVDDRAGLPSSTQFDAPLGFARARLR